MSPSDAVVARDALAGEPVLVTGGAGYIGAHLVLALLEAGALPVVLDDLSTGSRAAVPDGVPFAFGSVGDAALVGGVLADHRVGTVVHLAGRTSVPGSLRDPLAYYTANVADGVALIGACAAAGVRRILFSSTAAVYGRVPASPVRESRRPAPTTPYGASKLMLERILADAAGVHGFDHAALRYFNVAGADPQARAGRQGPPAADLISAVCAVATGRYPRLEIFGDDHPTPDGTCVRDFIHVSDLADAHLAVLRHLLRRGGGLTLNCGYGRGASVRAVLEAASRISGRSLPSRIAPRRPGDQPFVVADAGALARLTGWRPQHDSLEEIVHSALRWAERHPI